MEINSIKAYSCCPKPIKFKGNEEKNGYENPINRTTEKNLAILGSVGTSGLIGLSALGLTSCITSNRKIQGLVGIVAGLGALALTLPSKLYNTKVGAFTREKEMDVFSRQKEAQKNIYDDVNNEIKDENVSLDDKIKHYSTVAMADNGKGVLIKGA